MPMTPEEQRAWELQAYGCAASELKESVEASVLVTIAKRRGNQRELARAYGMVAMSMLSDAQELIDMSQRAAAELRYADQARQKINQAKLIIGDYWMRRGDD